MGPFIVQVRTPDSHGSGAFVGRDLVMTAAHVIHPRDRGEPYAPGELKVIRRDGTELSVIARLCHERWTRSFHATADIALVRVDAPQPDLVLGCIANSPAKKRKVTITGFFEGPRTGSVTRMVGPDGRDTLQSDDLVFHEGVSGAPVVDASGKAIGVATRSPDAALDGAFIGIPFLDNDQERNLARLIERCAKQDT
jgi:V8-like Glu-specific endopeptidase